mmetsp:Transcript_16407/g.39048  ORF Transcript_16407/g.39048 Transcript_16407/m.39048 type:complete len:189 (-) Transcript_16407:33-599(-)
MMSSTSWSRFTRRCLVIHGAFAAFRRFIAAPASNQVSNGNRIQQDYSTGLVLALDTCSTGSCEGIALRLSSETARSGLNAVDAREMITNPPTLPKPVYQRLVASLHLADGRTVNALAFVADKANPASYAGQLAEHVTSTMIATRRGIKGPNFEYLFNTLDALDRANIHDASLTRLGGLVRAQLKSLQD